MTSKSYVRVLIPVSVNVTLFGSRVFADVIKLKTMSCWIRVGPIHRTGVLVRGGKET